MPVNNGFVVRVDEQQDEQRKFISEEKTYIAKTKSDLLTIIDEIL